MTDQDLAKRFQEVTGSVPVGYEHIAADPARPESWDIPDTGREHDSSHPGETLIGTRPFDFVAPGTAYAIH